MGRIYLLLLASLVCTVRCDIFSCGGFVKSNVPVDFSKVQVKLLTPEGHLKHEEDVNAQNGYYMIPVYAKGSYAMKVVAPEGWHFEPSTVEVTIDGVNDACSKNQDINFQLTGFSIQGTVESGTGGPTGLPLSLTQNGKTVATTVTSEGGKYSFKAQPGEYTVTAGAESSVCLERGTTNVKVSTGPVHVTPALRISGYQLTVKVNSKGQSVGGVDVTLDADNDPKLSGCRQSGSRFACVLGKSASNGQLVVPCLPPGAYQLTASKVADGSTLHFTPNPLKLTMLAKQTEVSFSVAGVQARARVVSGSKGVSGARVTVNGKAVGESDKDGYVAITVSEGRLQLEASKDKTKFSKVDVNIKLADVKIPNIKVEEFELCGSVEQSTSAGSAASFVVKSESGQTSSVRADGAGKFCKMLAPAKYTIQPADASSALTPRQLEVDLREGGVENVRFTYFKTDLEVAVECVAECGDVAVALRLGSQLIKTETGTRSLLFNDIGPGSYSLQLSDGDRACWEARELKVVVERARPQPVHFKQTGYNAHVKLSHPAEMTWKHSSGASGSVSGSAGVNSFCVPSAGAYSVQLASCRTFGENPLSMQVPSSSAVEAVAKDALLSGRVASKDNAAVNVLVKSSAGEKSVAVKNGVFEWNEPLSSVGQDIVLVPQSDSHLFEPASQVISFNGECNKDVAAFEAHKGIFVDGSVSPAVEGVAITAQHTKDQHVTFDTTTDANGRFRVGPVRRAEDLSIEGKKDGYAISKGNKIGQLSAVKLSKLNVVVSDLAVAGSRLDGVLLSLVGGSGQQQYRSNNMIGESGEMQFVGLAPGDYFVRPILQEYKFDPVTTSVTVKEGEHEHVEIKGKRVAYSVFGRIREMSGAAVEGAVVEALSEQCGQLQAEAVSAVDGRFRIRALKPHCEYRVALKSAAAGAPAPHCFPRTLDVRMTADDVDGVELVVTPVKEATELAVEVDTSGMPHQPQSVKVSVSRGDQLIHQQVLVHPVHIVLVPNVSRDGQEYTVRVEPDRPHAAFAPVQDSFRADAAVRVVRLPLVASRRSSEVEISYTSILAVPLFALIALAVMNQNKTLEILAQLRERFDARPNSPNGRKKRN